MTGDLDVLVVGGTGVDHIVRVPLLPLPVRDSLTVPPIQSVVGHTGTGVALGCAALGLRTALVDVIGDDMEGRLVQDRFASAGVELATATHPSGTRRAVNLVTPDGSRMSLYDPRPPVVVVTDGAHGSAVHRRDESPLRVPAVSLPGRPVVDTNGAGDAYAAAYLFSWLAGAFHADAARAGAVAGA